MVGLFAVVSFMRTFPLLDARELGCATLGEALRDGRVRRALATNGLAYSVANRAPRPGQVNYWVQLTDECPRAAPPLAFFDRARSCVEIKFLVSAIDARGFFPHRQRALLYATPARASATPAPSIPTTASVRR